MVFAADEQFDIAQIAQSGQCFRLLPAGEGRFRLIALGRVLEIERRRDGWAFACGADEFDAVWRPYFDLDTDYSAFLRAADPADAYLQNAVRYGQGIRILRQEPWETLITFILSQRRNIPAIRHAVEALAARFGRPLGEGLFSFPDASALADAGTDALAACSLGYRTPYVARAAEKAAAGLLCPEALAALDDDDLRAALESLDGVGPKVAGCVMLFGFHRLAAFPRDVWINRAVSDQYDGNFPLEKYAGFEGVMQQYLFFYARAQGTPPKGQKSAK